ncbi:MAG TPA: exodeoxyribonuclease V subunit alpha [Rubrivivax sp.]|nr:exodeoxyribonuclease V subunit alpha [Rubrivivax sp.]
MNERAVFDPGQALAEGFACQAERWAHAQGADALAARRLREAARALSLAIGAGHVCLPLADLAAELADSPGSGELRRLLLASGVVGTPQTAGGQPLVLDDEQRLYLRRHFDYEQRLARRLVRAAGAAPALPDAAASQRLRALFQGSGKDPGPDWQKLAAALALRQRLVIISGGPGTGKTTTVVNLLACLLEQQPEARIALAAPTGKAAARMSEALRERAAHLPPALRERLPAEAGTVHRLLGAHPRGFLHDAARPLAVDALVVDEASMLDLALATRLFEAVPDTARLILLGDKDQLAAVESGAVFAELSADPSLSAPCIAELARLCELPPQAIVPAPALQASPLRDSVVWLARNFRFGADSAIARAATLVREGRAEALLQQLRSGGGALHWLDDAAAAPDARTLQAMREGFAPYFQALREGAGAAALTQAFGRFRVLCAHRDGPRGAQAVNRRLADEARALLAPGTPSDTQSPFFPGRPLMVLRNDPLLRLFNGDIGITLPGADGAPLVHFADAAGGFRALPAMRLPAHETAFAMTVHKAQGSEFDAVLVLLPAQRSRVLSRELLYTALTRARQRVWLAAEAGVLAATVATRTRRQSGLLARLREAAAGA